MPPMTTLYPGAFPPNPYGDLFDADTCVAQPHDVVMILGCPNDDDGAPSEPGGLEGDHCCSRGLADPSGAAAQENRGLGREALHRRGGFGHDGDPTASRRPSSSLPSVKL